MNIKSLRPTAFTRQYMLEIISQHREDQEKGVFTAAIVAVLIEKRLGLSVEQSMRHIGYLLSSKLIAFTEEPSPNQKVFLTNEGLLYRDAETFITEYWKKLEQRLVNFSLVAANLILVLAFFIKDSKTSDQLKAINTEMQNIRKSLDSKELKISVQVDSTLFHKTDSSAAD